MSPRQEQAPKEAAPPAEAAERMGPTRTPVLRPLFGYGPHSPHGCRATDGGTVHGKRTSTSEKPPCRDGARGTGGRKCDVWPYTRTWRPDCRVLPARSPGCPVRGPYHRPCPRGGRGPGGDFGQTPTFPARLKEHYAYLQLILRDAADPTAEPPFVGSKVIPRIKKKF